MSFKEQIMKLALDKQKKREEYSKRKSEEPKGNKN